MRKLDYHTTEYLRQCFDYQDGKLIWKVRPREHYSSDMVWKVLTKRCAGKEAGCIGMFGRKPHLFPRCSIILDSCSYYRSILVWVYHGNSWPELEIDHRDTDSTNDRIENLREATSNQNKANQSTRKSNTSGHKGVRFRKDRNKFNARITINNHEKHLGYFETFEEACEAYRKAAIENFGEFARFE